jgi:hypothetical protein
MMLASPTDVPTGSRSCGSKPTLECFIERTPLARPSQAPAHGGNIGTLNCAGGPSCSGVLEQVRCSVGCAGMLAGLAERQVKGRALGSQAAVARGRAGSLATMVRAAAVKMM